MLGRGPTHLSTGRRRAGQSSFVETIDYNEILQLLLFSFVLFSHEGKKSCVACRFSLAVCLMLRARHGKQKKSEKGFGGKNQEKRKES